MLTINTQNDKLAAVRINFSACGMLDGTCLSEVLEKLQTTEDINDSNSDTGADYNSDDGEDLDADEDEDRMGLVDGLSALSEVTLAQKRGEFRLLFYISNCF